MPVVAVTGDAALVFIEIGAVAIALALLARLSSRLAMSAIPFYLLAGLVVGQGGVVTLDVSAEFISVAGQIGVLLLLLALGVEYTAEELHLGLRTGAVPGTLDAAANFTPGFGMGLLLGWDIRTSLLLGGVCWISSSGVIAKVLTDLDRLGYRETSSVLTLLVLEDIAMAAYLPLMAALLSGAEPGDTVVVVVIALAAVAFILALALRWGRRLSDVLAPASNEALLLSVFGLTLLVGGLAEQLEVSAAIGAFLVGLALSGPVQMRVAALIEPLRDLFAATFFLFFAFQIRPASLIEVAIPVVALAAVTAATKVATGWVAAGRAGVAVPGRLRAGTALIARGEFSIVIASLGIGTTHGEQLGALAAGYVLLTAVGGALLTKHAEHLTGLATFRSRTARSIR